MRNSKLVFLLAVQFKIVTRIVKGIKHGTDYVYRKSMPLKKIIQ